MTVSVLDFSIESVNHKLRFLMLTDFSTRIYSLFFRVVVTAGALCATFLNIPTAIGVVNNVMSRFRHSVSPFVSFRTADCTAVCIPVEQFCFCNGFNLV